MADKIQSISPNTIFEAFFLEVDSFKSYLKLKQSNVKISIEHHINDPFLDTSKTFLDKFLNSQPEHYITRSLKRSRVKSKAAKSHEDKAAEALKTSPPINKFKGYKRSRPWTKADDQILMKIAISYSNDWNRISRRVLTLCKLKKNINFLKNRFQILKKDLYKQKVLFTEDEDIKISEGVERHGKNWIEIAKEIPTRAPLMLKNRFYYLKKKDGKREVKVNLGK
jgi:Myb-like DNA-binding domain